MSDDNLRCTCMTVGNSAQIAKADPACPRHAQQPPDAQIAEARATLATYRNRVWSDPYAAWRMAHVLAALLERFALQQPPSADVWRPIQTAPIDSDPPILMTDGQWFAAGYVGREDCRIHHFAVSQESDWEPTHWMPLPSPPPSLQRKE